MPLPSTVRNAPPRWPAPLLVALLSSCATPTAPLLEKPETQVFRESQAEWETALPGRLEVVRARVGQCYTARVAAVEAAAVEGAYREQPAPKLAGRVELVVPIEDDGRLGAVGWALDELDDVEFRGCVTRELGRIRLEAPPDGEPVEVTVPFRFTLGAATE